MGGVVCPSIIGRNSHLHQPIETLLPGLGQWRPLPLVGTRVGVLLPTGGATFVSRLPQ